MGQWSLVDTELTSELRMSHYLEKDQPVRQILKKIFAYPGPPSKLGSTSTARILLCRSLLLVIV